MQAVKRAGIVLFISASVAFAGDTENWAQWRGPSLDGSSKATGLPVKWSKTENIRWKTALPSWSGSTPIIWGDRIFLMSPSALKGNDKAPTVKSMAGARIPEGKDILLLCLSKEDGSVLWHRALSDDNYHIGKQNMSSPSPVTDGKHVWVMTGTGILAKFDFEGEEQWRLNVQDDSGKFGMNWGFGASPLLYENKLIIPVMHGWDTDDPSYILAYDKDSGQLLWKVERPTDAVREGPDAYTTPMPMHYDDRVEIIISGGDYVTGHDPKTGKEIWRSAGLNPKKDEYYRAVSSPLIVNDLVIASTKKDPIIGVRGGGKGLVTDTHLVWSNGIAPDVPTPVYDGKYLYILHDEGAMSCLNPETGKPYYEKVRLPRGTYSASPLLADGKIYVTSEGGTTAVLKTGPTFELVEVNEMEDAYTLSSIVVSGRNLFLRTSDTLYCIGDEGN